MRDIRDLNYSELESALIEFGEKKFRAKQIYNWLWKRGALSFNEMTDISLALREKLSEYFSFSISKIKSEAKSSDGTAKFIIELSDNQLIESVLIPHKNRVTACISSQVGCPLGCAFCATGTMGFIRNLSFHEIIDEYLLLNSRAQLIYNQYITNIVFMGMGEPLLNINNISKAIELLTNKDGYALSPSRITISTAGIVKGIKTLADMNLHCGLAISLHSANPNTRREIMPVTENNSLQDLQSALAYFHKTTGERITIEYLLLSKINDSVKDAELLARFCRAFPVKVNIIEYNETDNSPFEKTDSATRERFIAVLENCNMIVNIRLSKGQDIDAACGQLVKKVNKKSFR